MKRILGILGLCLLLAGMFVNLDYSKSTARNNELLLKNVIKMAAADSESGDRIICNCTLLGKCKADGGGSVCAQSQPGGNIHCDDYNGNC